MNVPGIMVVREVDDDPTLVGTKRFQSVEL